MCLKSIRVEKDGFATATKTVTLENGGVIVEEFRLDNVMGRIEVRTIPVGVEVFLDGSRVGTTKSKGDGGDASEVFAIENVREGEHTLVLRREGSSLGCITKNYTKKRGYSKMI